MKASVLQIILFSLIPVFTMVAGGVIALIKQPSKNIQSLILHFAAGVIFSVVAVEILPDIIKVHKPWDVIAGFTAGVVAMLLVSKYAGANEDNPASAKTKLQWTLIIPIAVDIFIDGLLLGIGFSAGKTEGILLAVALSLELLSLGLSTSAELGNEGNPKKRSLFIILSLAAVFFISAILGATLLHNLSDNVLDILLSFGLAALLYLVTEELLKEAHEEKETPWHTTAFFAGFLILLILGMTV